MKYKIIAYISSVITAVALCVTALLGFKLINYKGILENSGGESVVVVKAIIEKDNEDDLILERAYFDILGESLKSVIEKDSDFTFDSKGFVEGIKGIKPDREKSYWSISSSTHEDCKNNVSQSCGAGAPYLYLNNVNEFVFTLKDVKVNFNA